MNSDLTLLTSCSRLLEAAHFAAMMHRGNRRKDRDETPYINHPISVARTIVEVGGVDDIDVLVAALLHDTIEDTPATAQEVENKFGKQVRVLVEEVSDDKSLPSPERKRLQINRAASLSPEAVVIALADKSDNVSDVSLTSPADWDIERKVDYLTWSEKVVDNCPEANKPLKQYFKASVADARIRLGVKDNPY